MPTTAEIGLLQFQGYFALIAYNFNKIQTTRANGYALSVSLKLISSLINSLDCIRLRAVSIPRLVSRAMAN
jgi:hypothetical protein